MKNHTRFNGQPWAVLPAAGESFAAQCTLETSEAFLFDVEAPPTVAAQSLDNVGVVTARGVVLKNPDAVDCMFGAMDVDALADAVRAMDEDEGIDAIVLHIDSPGGTVTGVPEAAAIIEGASKPVVAFTDSLAASAAYWLPAGASAFVATPSAQVGSIGVYQMLYDWSRAFEDAGVRPVLVKAGDLKAAGITGPPITDDQVAEFQRGVDSVYEAFTDHVTSNRPLVEAESMQGQCFYATEAVERGLFDGVVSGIQDAVALAQSLAR